MKILVTGSQGYVGPVVVRHLRQVFPQSVIEGFDAGWFAHCLTGVASAPEVLLDRQHVGDVRALPAALLEGVDAVVHLAAVSNDPIGKRFEEVTDEINRAASLDMADKARAAGVKAFVFASSCSVYGFAEGAPRRERDALNPQTAYARSKVATELALAERDLAPMVVTSLRFATACGWSDRLRLDLVLNDFVAAAIATGTVSVLSDGSPWRPLIDVRDMARAIAWAVTRTADKGGTTLSVNAGGRDSNYQVKDLANRVAMLIPGTRVAISTDAQPDTRSYQVDFSLFHELAPDAVPQVTLDESITLLREGLTGMRLREAELRDSPLIRLRALDAHIAAGRLDGRLRWRREALT